MGCFEFFNTSSSPLERQYGGRLIFSLLSPGIGIDESGCPHNVHADLSLERLNIKRGGMSSLVN